MENLFKDYEKRSAGQEVEDIKYIQKIIRNPEKDFKAIVGSMRWKLGDGFFSFIDALCFRGKMPTAFDHINEIYKEYHQWQVEKKE